MVCIHGISSTRKLWLWLHEAAPELTLVCPDLRGRGDSRDVEGRSSLVSHVGDVVAVMDAEGIDRAVVCGMSMGGFVAVRLASLHPSRVASVVLVDGGLPMTPPSGLSPDTVEAAFADRFRRLGRSWASLDEYRQLFVGSTAPLLDPSDPVLADYLGHDLDGGDRGTVRLSPGALAADAADIFFGEPSPWDSLEMPVHLLHAEWSTGAGTPPAYGPELLAAARSRLASVELIPGTDHAATIMSPAGAGAVARVLRSVVAPAR